MTKYLPALACGLAMVAGCSSMDSVYINYRAGVADAGEGREELTGPGLGLRKGNFIFDTHLSDIGEGEDTSGGGHSPFGPGPRLSVVRETVKYGRVDRKINPYLAGGVGVVSGEGQTEVGVHVGTGVNIGISELFSIDAVVLRDFFDGHDVLEGSLVFTVGADF